MKLELMVMMIDNFFITPHAVEQFQKRIARLSDEQAREVIRAGVSQAANVRVLPDGETLRVRTVKPFPYEFRAYCVFDHERGHRVVTTIVWGDSRATRKRRALARLNSAAASVASEFSPVFQRRNQSAVKDPRRGATLERTHLTVATRRFVIVMHRDPTLRRLCQKLGSQRQRREM